MKKSLVEAFGMTFLHDIIRGDAAVFADSSIYIERLTTFRRYASKLCLKPFSMVSSHKLTRVPLHTESSSSRSELHDLLVWTIVRFWIGC